MSAESTVFDSPSSFLAGTYRQNAFYIRMNSLFDLGSSEDDLLPTAVAMNAHEYVHFLHNSSTVAGQAYLLSNLILMRLMVFGCDDQGLFLGEDVMSDESRRGLRYVTNVMCSQLGSTSAGILDECKLIDEWRYGIPRKINREGVDYVVAEFSCSNQGEVFKRDIILGLCFITEGVAYEVDREMRRLSGMPEDGLDLHTDIFPYRSFREALKCWSGRDLQPRDVISIGVAALSGMSSGSALMDICGLLKNNDNKGLDELLEGVLERACVQWTTLLNAFQGQRKGLSQGDVIMKAMDEYVKLIEAGTKLRGNIPYLEYFFIEKPMSREGFFEAVGQMLDCLVIQEGSNGALNMYWAGPGIVAQTNHVMGCLGALQSALHFTQLHIKVDGSVSSTDALPGTEVECPFSGGCEVERNDNYPLYCKSSPWLRYSPSMPGEKVCWYAAGVKALRKKEGMSPEVTP